MRRRMLVALALLLTALVALSGGCGATRQRAPMLQSPALIVPSTPTPATATIQRATEQASPNWEPGLGGMLIDFFLAVIFGNDAKARGYFAPGLYAPVKDLPQAFGLPDPRASTGSHLTFDSHLIADEGDRLLVETDVIVADGPTVRERVTLTRDATYRKITAVVPVGLARPQPSRSPSPRG